MQKVHFTKDTATCWRRCGAQGAGHWHIFWECSKIQSFWVDVHKAIVDIFHIKIPLQFSTLFLENSVNFGRLPNKYLFSILLIAAKKAVTRCWLLPNPPTSSHWINIVNEIYRMEAITFSIRLKKRVFVKLWSEWVRYMKPFQPDFVEITCI